MPVEMPVSPVPKDDEMRRAVLERCGCPPGVVRDVLENRWEGEWPFTWRGDESWSCVIHGREYGTGKTHAATMLFLAEVSRRRRPLRYRSPSGEEQVMHVVYPGRWISYRDLVARARQAVQEHTVEALHRSLVEIQVLMVDDLTVDRMTDYVAEVLDYLLGERYDARRPTLVTSNARSIEELGAINGRIVSRLADGEVYRLGSDRWHDRRRARA